MELSSIFLTFGALFLAGLAADQIGRRTALPRVTLLMLCGVIAGKSGLNLIPQEATQFFEFLSVTALTMVAFLLGGSLDARKLASHGAVILWVSLSIVVVSIMAVAGGLWMAGMDIGPALLLGAIAAATAPAATNDAITQSGVKGVFTDNLRGIVAIDDAWGLLAFSLIIVIVRMLDGATDYSALGTAAWEIGGALALAAVIGFPAAILTGRITEGQPLEAEALGLVFVTAGAALWLDVSFLIAGMSVGAIIVNKASHHTRAFHEIEHIQWPFMILFFILAGASLEIGDIAKLGPIGAAYVILRILARIAGGWIGATLAGAPKYERPWFGIALLPQAGVAIGMSLLAAEAFPEYADLVLSLTIGSTIIFELLGPTATVYAVKRVQMIETRHRL